MRQPALLRRIFAQIDDDALIPSVRYIEVSGFTLGGQAVSERIIPR